MKTVYYIQNVSRNNGGLGSSGVVGKDTVLVAS